MMLDNGLARIRDFIFIEKIDSGSYAEVWTAIHSPTSHIVAVKIISLLNGEMSLKQIEREIEIFKSVNHPFIASYFGSFIENDHFFIVMEHCEGGTLRDFCNTSISTSERMMNKIFVQLVSTLDFLHNTKKIAHRDLKCENLLLDCCLNCKLIDFGFSTECDHLMSTQLGSIAYAAPEIIKGLQYTEKADIWSAGVLLYAMICSRLPFDHPSCSKMAEKIICQPIAFPVGIPDEICDLLSKMLTKDSCSRISIEEIKKHRWFTKYGYSVDKYVQKYFANETLDLNLLTRIQPDAIQASKIAEYLQEGIESTETISYKILKRSEVIRDMDREIYMSSFDNNERLEKQPTLLGLPKILIQKPACSAKNHNKKLINIGSMCKSIHHPTIKNNKLLQSPISK